MEVTTDAGELAQSREQDEQFDRNSDWLEAHAAEVYSQHRGQHICVAGQELFVAATAEDALDLARAAHPNETGILLRYISGKKAARICAHQRILADL